MSFVSIQSGEILYDGERVPVVIALSKLGTPFILERQIDGSYSWKNIGPR